MTFLRLFAAFAKVGVLTFGGGYAMIPMLEREIVDRHGWATSEELMDYYAVGQCTPGVIAVNTATFIGYKVAGNLGGIVATLGVVFPSFVILSLIAGIIQNFADIPAVKSAFAGIRVCVCVLIVQAVLRLWKSSVVDRLSLALYFVVFALTAFSGFLPVKVPAAVLVLLSGAAGIAISLARVRRGKGSRA